ncbi:hypothetical protein [Adhaeribacter terreus]|uniref:Uncharacterized protein n=1 Tax=Adhaeribacter terreus TaxID=529703 RepID=A0ABW0E6I0_9BACT
MKKFWPLFILFLVLAGRLPAQQKQGAWWYFGGLMGSFPAIKNAGVNFIPPRPSRILPDKELAQLVAQQ